MKIQILSDTHLEFYDSPDFKNFVDIKTKAEVLCLLGDICTTGHNKEFNKLVEFIKFLSSYYKYIIFVPGNHEYYVTGNKNITTSNTINYLNNKIKKISKIVGNFYFLNNDTLNINKGKKTYTFIGTTLWTFVEPKNRKKLQQRMNDYKEIYIVDRSKENNIRKFNINDMSKYNEKSSKFIFKILNKLKFTNNITILLTHHKPIKDCDDMMSQAYENDLVDKLSKYKIKLAAHGHTHEHYDKKIKNIRYVSNPKGYKGQKTHFNKAKVYNI